MKLLSYMQNSLGMGRRKIVDQMKTGQVTLNGEAIEKYTMECACGDVLVYVHNGKSMSHTIQDIPDQGTMIVSYHKPLGCVVSKSDPHNETIYESLPEHLQSFDYIGRLDKDSTGLLLLTNDKALVHQLAHPSSGVVKTYLVRVDTMLSDDEIDIIGKGLRVDENGQQTENNGQSDYLKVLSVKQEEKKGFVELKLELVEGHKRHIRRLLKAIGKKVFAIHRIAFGEYELKDLGIGERKIISVS